MRTDNGGRLGIQPRQTVAHINQRASTYFPGAKVPSAEQFVCETAANAGNLLPDWKRGECWQDVGAAEAVCG